MVPSETCVQFRVLSVISFQHLPRCYEFRTFWFGRGGDPLLPTDDVPLNTRSSLLPRTASTTMVGRKPSWPRSIVERCAAKSLNGLGHRVAGHGITTCISFE